MYIYIYIHTFFHFFPLRKQGEEIMFRRPKKRVSARARLGLGALWFCVSLSALCVRVPDESLGLGVKLGKLKF